VVRFSRRRWLFLGLWLKLMAHRQQLSSRSL
jgi:hypothetical protein